MFSITFTLTRREYVGVTRYRLLRNWRTWGRIAFLVAMILVASLLGNLFDSVPLVLGAVFLFFALALGVLVVQIPNQGWRNSQYLHSEQTLTMTDEGIHFQYLNAETRLDWSQWSTIETLPEAHLLVSKRSWYPIPKRAFNSESQEATFLELSHRHLHTGG